MAAHLVVEYPISQETTTFSGTPEDQSAYLKIFWKSIHLNPTIESRLISSDIRQRTKVVPLIGSAPHKFTFREEDPPKLADYFEHVSTLEVKDQIDKRLRCLEKRDDLLRSHKIKEKSRVETQKKSGQEVISGHSLPVIPPITPDPDRNEAEERENSQAEVGELEKFDELHNLDRNYTV